jgi:hypothetical protein
MTSEEESFKVHNSAGHSYAIPALYGKLRADGAQHNSCRLAICCAADPQGADVKNQLFGSTRSPPEF